MRRIKRSWRAKIVMNLPKPRNQGILQQLECNGLPSADPDAWGEELAKYSQKLYSRHTALNLELEHEISELRRRAKLDGTDAIDPVLTIDMIREAKTRMHPGKAQGTAAQPVFARVGILLHKTGADQRAEHAQSRGFVEARETRKLAQPNLRSEIAEILQQAQGFVDGRHAVPPGDGSLARALCSR